MYSANPPLAAFINQEGQGQFFLQGSKLITESHDMVRIQIPGTVI